MTLDYLHIPAAILMITDLSLREKLLLSGVAGFREKGLRESNAELAKLLDVLPSRVSELLVSLESKGWVEIQNRRSRHRVVYFRPNPKVLLSTQSESRAEKGSLLSTLDGLTFDVGRNKTKELQEKESVGRLAFVLRTGKQWHLPEVKLGEYTAAFPKLDVQAELRESAQWLIDNPSRRKTAKGMSRFLGGWLRRAKPGNGQPLPSEKSEAEIEAACQEVYR